MPIFALKSHHLLKSVPEHMYFCRYLFTILECVSSSGSRSLLKADLAELG